MANITLSGDLLDPAGFIAIGDTIRFTHKSNTGKVVKSSLSQITIPTSGSYLIDLQYGLVKVDYKDVLSNTYTNLGVVTVNQDTTATTLPELLNAVVPPTDAQLLEFQAILADCVTESSNAAQSATEAATSATDAAASAATIDLINDLSQAYIFDAVADMQASTIVFPVGKNLKIQSNNVIEATYVVIPSGVATKDQDLTLQSGDIASYQKTSTEELIGYKDITDVFIVYGQSNAKGSAGSTSGRADITEYASYWSRINQDIRHLIYTSESCSDQGAGSLSTGHAWGAFANTYYRMTGRRMLFVIGAIGGETIEALSKGDSSGIYSDTLIEYDKAVAAINGEKGKTFMLFNQGESDMSGGTTWDDYFGYLVDMFVDFKTDFNVEDFICATVGNPASRDELDWHRIRNAQEYAFDREESATIGFEGFKYFTELNDCLRSDGTHATQKGYNRMGEALAKSAVDVLVNGHATGGNTGYFNGFFADTVSTNRVKKVSAVVKLDDTGGAILTRDTSTIHVSSNVTGVSTTASNMILECEGLRNNVTYAIDVFAYDYNNPDEAIHSSAEAATVENNKLAISVTLTKDFTFAIQTDLADRGIYKQLRSTNAPIEIYDTDSLSLDDSGTYIDINHNAVNTPLMFTRGTNSSSVPSTGDCVMAARNSNQKHKIPKDIGWVLCHIPSFLIRPDSVKSGTDIRIHINVESVSDAD